MLINEMRSDLGEIVNADLSTLPFVMGQITRNPDNATQPPYVYMVNEAQVAVTGEIANTYIVDTTGLKQLDGWHYSADAQHWIGREFVNTITSASGKFGVTMTGLNATMTGGGAKEKGESVTVTFKPYDKCTLNSVKIKVGSGDATLIELDENGSYTFTMPEDNVSFVVDCTDEGAVRTKYGIIPSRFADADEFEMLTDTYAESLICVVPIKPPTP